MSEFEILRGRLPKPALGLTSLRMTAGSRGMLVRVLRKYPQVDNQGMNSKPELLGLRYEGGLL